MFEVLPLGHVMYYMATGLTKHLLFYARWKRDNVLNHSINWNEATEPHLELLRFANIRTERWGSSEANALQGLVLILL